MDYGVDATLEIIAGNRATNYLAQVQIKSTQCAELNQDGSASKSIEVSNLNYLLNGSSPLYLFYSRHIRNSGTAGHSTSFGG